MRSVLALFVLAACSTPPELSVPPDQAWLAPFPDAALYHVGHATVSKSGEAPPPSSSTFWRLPAGLHPKIALDHYVDAVTEAGYRIDRHLVTEARQGTLQASRDAEHLSVSIDRDPNDTERLFAVVTMRSTP